MVAGVTDNAAGSLMLVLSVWVQPMLSVTATEYVAGASPLIEEVVAEVLQE